MRLDENGLLLSKAELTALLGFCSKDPEKPNLCVVQVRTRDDVVFAYATDGKRAVSARGHATPDSSHGEWLVRRECLDQARRALDGSQCLRLKFSFSSLNEARIEQQGVEVATLNWPQDAAVFQASFPDVAGIVRIPHVSDEVARCAGIAAEYLADIKLMAKAASVTAVDCYPPRTNRDPAYFCADGEDTTWTAVVMPTLTDASAAEAARPRRRDPRQAEMYDDDEPVVPRNAAEASAMSPVEQAVEDRQDTLDKHGATMTVKPGGRVTKVGGKGKSKAKPAAKPKTKARGRRGEARA
jgi:hypothetical protein